MKCSLPLLGVFCVFGTAMAVRAQSTEALPPYFEINFDEMEVGKPPETSPFRAGETNKKPTEAKTMPEATLKVVESAGLLDKKPLLFSKTGKSPRLPALILGGSSKSLISGKTRISWEAAVLGFQPGPNYPGFEGTLTLNVYNTGGQIIYHLTMGTQGRKSGGDFIDTFGKVPSSSWNMGDAKKVEVVLDVDARTVTLMIDGNTVRHQNAWPQAAPIRMIEFRDAAAHNAYDGTFDAAIDNVLVAPAS